MKKLVLVTIILITGIITLNHSLFNSLQKKQTELKNAVDHTHEVIIETEKLIKSLTDAETGQRGYLLTLDHNYLEPYYSGKIEAVNYLGTLKRLTNDNPNQQKRLQQVESLMQKKFDELGLTIELANDDIKKSLAVVKNNSGKIFMDQMRVIINEFIQEENDLLEIRKINEKIYKSKFAKYELMVDIFGLIVFIAVLYLFIKQNMNLQSRLSKELEINLKESRERFEDVSENISDWIWEVNNKGEYTYVSAKVKDFLGYEPFEILGNTPFDTMSEKEAKRVKKLFLKYVKEQKPFRDLININIHKDGHKVTLQTSGFPIFDKYGDFAGYRGTDKDITKLNRLITDLQETKKNLSDAQQIAKVGSWSIELRSKNLSWSDEMYYIFEADKDKFIPSIENFLQFIHPEDLVKVHKAYSTPAETKKQSTMDYRLKMLDNRVKYVREQRLIKYDENDSPILFQGTLQDITESKITQMQTLRYLKLVDQNIITSSTDLNGIITEVSQAFCDISGFSKLELIGHNLRMIRHPDVSKSLYSDLWKTIKANKIWHGEIKNRKKDGSSYWVETTISPTYNDNGEKIGYTAIRHDITQKKELEKVGRELEVLYNKTKDSINYASLIQQSLIPNNETFSKYFNDFFTIWEPKDIVGGDIYFFEEFRDDSGCIVFVVDCTGHGVAGAFVTMIVKTLQRQIISNIRRVPNNEISTSSILEYFNKNVKKLLKQETVSSTSNVGFDGAILYYNKKEKVVKFSGASIPLYLLENNELKTIKGDRHSIGYRRSDENYKFTEHTIKLNNEMQFYLTTDGYLDQNGGEKGFPMGQRRFKEIINQNKNKPLKDQKEIFIKSLKEYQKDEVRNDDITLIALKL